MTIRDRFHGNQVPKDAGGHPAAAAIVAAIPVLLLAAGCGAAGVSMGVPGAGMPGSLTDGSSASQSEASQSEAPVSGSAAAGQTYEVGSEGMSLDVEASLSAGRELFLAKGCSACHGLNGEGSPAAPALGGHSREGVLKQVRQPMDKMPAFGPDQVSDEELEDLATFVSSLAVDPDSPFAHHGGGHDHDSAADDHDGAADDHDSPGHHGDDQSDEHHDEAPPDHHGSNHDGEGDDSAGPSDEAGSGDDHHK